MAKSKRSSLPPEEPKEVPPHIPGYPTLSLDAVGRLLIRIGNGEGVKRGCLAEGICRQTFYEALRDHKPLVDNYARARELEADLHADDVLEISDDENLSEGEKKIRIDARKWSAAVRRPKLYGQKIEISETADPLTPAGKRQRVDQLVEKLSRLRVIVRGGE